MEEENKPKRFNLKNLSKNTKIIIFVVAMIILMVLDLDVLANKQ